MNWLIIDTFIQCHTAGVFSFKKQCIVKYTSTIKLFSIKGQDGSRQSGRVTFPNSAKSVSTVLSGIYMYSYTNCNWWLLVFFRFICMHLYIKLSFSFADELVPLGNPFKMPADSDIFVLRDKERQRKKLVRSKIIEIWILITVITH